MHDERLNRRTNEEPAMTTTVLAAAIRMPHAASVAAPAPHAPGASAEPCAAAMSPAARGLDMGGIIAPAVRGRRNGTEIGDRFGGKARSSVGSAWYGQDSAQLAGGGPLRA
ncbi:MAG TPA: hypothetical protein VF092_04245 [Longimicrobium sp.]